MSDQLYSPKRALARAQHHIADLRSKTEDFMNGRAPGTYTIERTPGHNNNRHIIKFDRDFFEELSCISFDAANNLRSALDQVAYATAVAASEDKSKKIKKAHFPIADSVDQLENVIKINCRALRVEITALFKTFHPHGGGNIWLAALNKLCNTQKHAALVPFKTDQHSVMYVTKGMRLGLGHRWDAQRFELELLGLGGADFTNGGGYFAFGLSFDFDDPTIGGSDPVGLLSGAAIQVDRVLKATDDECRRLGLWA